MYNICINFFDRSKIDIEYDNTITISDIKDKLINDYKKINKPKYLYFIYYGSILEDKHKFIKKNIKLNGYINRKFYKNMNEKNDIMDDFINYVSNINGNLSGESTIISSFISILSHGSLGANNNNLNQNNLFQLNQTQVDLSGNTQDVDSQVEDSNRADSPRPDTDSDISVTIEEEDNNENVSINNPFLSNSENFREQNEILMGMGYHNIETNMFVLEINHGDLNNSIDFLESLK